MVRDFNVGTLNSGIWTSLPFVWSPVKVEGVYQVEVVVKDFNSGETASHTARFQVTPLVTGSTPVAVPTANPLVAFFSAPACPSGSSMRVIFQPQSQATPPVATSAAACHPPTTMTFEIGGMYPSTTYTMHAQTITSGTPHNGPPITFTTGSLPGNVPFPGTQTLVPPDSNTDTAESVLLLGPLSLTMTNNFPAVATDLAGNIVWYYYPTSPDHFQLVARPLAGGTILSIQNDTAWNSFSTVGQVLRQVDLAGNIVRETNTGIVQRQLVALGSSDGGPCPTSSSHPVGTACLGSFHHDAIQTLPNGWTAVLADIERIFPPGAQGDTSGLPVDIVGDMIIVLDNNWQVKWYFDAFQHAGGAPQLDINRPAVLGETCINGQPGCQPMFLLGPNIAPTAKDWLHANSIYYQPQDGNLIWSSRHQDWVMKVDYANGAGTGSLLWRMGREGDFFFNNIYADPWPWFSHQHDAGIENNGAGRLTVFDNGDTRVSPAPIGLGSGNSRGMALNVNQTSMRVSPFLSDDLGVYALALGSAQLLSNGNYAFLAAVLTLPGNITGSEAIEVFPTSGTPGGTQVLNLIEANSYRAWRLASLYAPPTT